jgi:hypothetical protein
MCCFERATSIGWTIGQSPRRAGGATNEGTLLVCSAGTPVRELKWGRGGEAIVGESDTGEGHTGKGRVGEDDVGCVKAAEVVRLVHT